MPNLSSLAPLTTAATALSNLVLVSPQATVGYQPLLAPTTGGIPQTAQQPPAFLFHYEGEQTVAVESDITDHFVQDNTASQDQIALRPEMVTTHGYIGELNDVAPFGLQTIKAIADKLTVIGAYAPELSTTALLAYNEAFFAYQVAANVVNSAVAAWSSILGGALSGNSTIDSEGVHTFSASPQNRQQTAFQQLYGYWRTRTLFNVQTPWAVFQNMAIKSMRSIQSEETNVITDFEVTFKMIRFASTKTLAGDITAQFQGQAKAQAASLVDQGVGAPGPTSSLTSSITAAGG